MSLILEALSRAERDKRARETGVPDILSSSITAERPRRRGWPIALAGILGLLLLTVFWWVAGGGSDNSDVLQTPASSSAILDPRVADVSTSAAAKSVSSAASSDQSVRAEVPVAGIAKDALQRPQRSGAEQAAIDALYTAASASDQESPKDVDPVPAKTSAVAVPAVQTVDTPVDMEQVLRSVRRAQTDDGLSEHPVEVLDSLSKQFRDRVPTLMYLRHDYAEGATTSSVVINGKTLRAGQRTGAVEVVTILRDSVILRFDGTEFRLRALNSWVNL